MRLDNYLYFVLDYARDDKRQARVVKMHKNDNLLCLYDKEYGFGKIMNDLGDIALLEIVMLASNQDHAYEIMNMWNETYKHDNRYFGGI